VYRREPRPNREYVEIMKGRQPCNCDEKKPWCDYLGVMKGQMPCLVRAQHVFARLRVRAEGGVWLRADLGGVVRCAVRCAVRRDARGREARRGLVPRTGAGRLQGRDGAGDDGVRDDDPGGSRRCTRRR
jgi:hypothetical protein